MTVKDLHTDIFERGKKNNAHISDLGVNCILGIDLSIYLYRILSHKICVEQYHAGPGVPVTHALSLLKNKHDQLVSKCCTPLYVFDGAKHPMKHATNEQRKLIKAGLERRLSELEDKDEIEKLQARCVYPREDILKLVVQWMKEEDILHFSAPFEAEWQLVSLERQGLIDAIVSEDGDCLILGAKTVVTRLNFSTGSCYIYNSNEVWQRECAGRGGYQKASVLPEMATFLGNDYIHRLYGFSPTKVKSSIMPSYIAATDKDQYLDEIEQTCKWPKSHDPNFKKPAAGFASKFKKVTNLFRYPPIFSLELVNGYEEINLYDPSSYNVTLKPLNCFDNIDNCAPMPSAIERKWGETIGKINFIMFVIYYFNCILLTLVFY